MSSQAKKFKNRKEKTKMIKLDDLGKASGGGSSFFKLEDGQSKRVMNIVAERVTFLSSKKQNDNN